VNFIRSLTLRQLQIFVIASRYLSFARTAEELHLSQPAVSMQIKQLESVVGLPLFERIGRKLTLTEAGEKLSHHASRVLGEIKDAQDTLTSLTQAGTGSINVGIVSTATYFAPKLLALFSELYPHVDVRFSVGNRETLLHLLQDNAIDLAIMGRPPRELDTVAEPLAYHPHVIVAPRFHPLRDARRFDLQELHDETFLLREPGSGTRLVSEQMFKNHLFTPVKMVTLGSNETIKQAVMAGMGVSLLSLICEPSYCRPPARHFASSCSSMPPPISIANTAGSRRHRAGVAKRWRPPGRSAEASYSPAYEMR
jgi:DNA-binding transcriptional LysR family regulator